MKSIQYFTLALLMCAAQAMFGCEPSVAVLDTTFGNAAQANTGVDGGFTELPAGISVYVPEVEGSMMQGVYDGSTGHIISIGFKNVSSYFMVTGTDGIITATVEYKFEDTPTIFRDIALLTNSTTVVVGGSTEDGQGNKTAALLFFDQQGTLLNSNISAFFLTPFDKFMQAVEVVSTDTIVLAGVVEDAFAVTFYNYDGVLTATVITPVDGALASQATDANVRVGNVVNAGLLSDNSIAVIGTTTWGLDSNALAFARYGLDGSFTNSITYSAKEVLPSASFAAISGLVPLATGNFLVSGFVADLSSFAIIPFLAQVSNDLSTFTPLRLLTEHAIKGVLNFVPTLSAAGNGSVIMTMGDVILSQSLFQTTLVKLTDAGNYDLTFGSCNGALVLPKEKVCVIQDGDEVCFNDVGLMAINSLVQSDGKILLFGSLAGSSDTNFLVPANFRINSSSVTLSTDPLTAAIQRKYFGITV